MNGFAKMAVTTALLLAALAGSGTGSDLSEVGWVELEIRHRMYPGFREVVTVETTDTTQIGDTEYYFRLVEFFPHFAFMDSSKTFVTRSPEPKNPAFRIHVIENDTIQDATWAFYSVTAPHFGETSYLAFHVLGFQYRGETFSKEPERDDK